jgi:hypothetical protein
MIPEWAPIPVNQKIRRQQVHHGVGRLAKAACAGDLMGVGWLRLQLCVACCMIDAHVRHHTCGK